MIRDKGRSKKKLKTLYIVLGLCTVLMVFFSAALVIDIYTTRQGRSFYTTLSGHAIEIIPRTNWPIQHTLGSGQEPIIFITPSGEIYEIVPRIEGSLTHLTVAEQGQLFYVLPSGEVIAVDEIIQHSVGTAPYIPSIGQGQLMFVSPSGEIFDVLEVIPRHIAPNLYLLHTGQEQLFFITFSGEIIEVTPHLETTSLRLINAGQGHLYYISPFGEVFEINQPTQQSANIRWWQGFNPTLPIEFNEAALNREGLPLRLPYTRRGLLSSPSLSDANIENSLSAQYLSSIRWWQAFNVFQTGGFNETASYIEEVGQRLLTFGGNVVRLSNRNNNEPFDLHNIYYTPEPFVPILDFEVARESIPDIIGWIQSEGTVINYPIVQGVDNDFYLNHLPDQSENKLGSIFVDYRNNPDFTDGNIIIYGHNTRTGDLFGSLRRYFDQQFYEDHDSMFIFTPTGNYKVLFFAGYTIDVRNESLPSGFAGSADFERYVSGIRSRSIFRSAVDVSYGDQLVFLVTCHGASGGPVRLILVGRLAEVII
jgi:sortase B